MKRSLLLLSLAGVLALTGCGDRDRGAGSSNPGDPGTTVGSNGKGSDVQTPTGSAGGGTTEPDPVAKEPGTKDPGTSPTTKPSTVTKPVVRAGQPAKMSALELAKRVDKAIASMKNVKGEVKYLLDLSEAKARAQGTHVAMIQDSKRFRIQYAHVDMKKPKDHYVTELLIGDGKRKVAIGLEGAKTIDPVKGRDFHPGKNVVKEWAAKGSAWIYSGLASGKPSFGPLIDGLQKQGYKVEATETRVPYQNQTLTLVQISAKRPANSKTGAGASEILMKFDGTHYLPVTIFVEDEPRSGVKNVWSWSAKWQGPITFDNKEFQIPKDSNLQSPVRTE